VVQSLFSYLYNAEKEVYLTAGLGARLSDMFDIPIHLAMDVKDLRVGLTYDMNIGATRSATNTFGALELAVTKIFTWTKPIEVEPVFICPRL